MSRSLAFLVFVISACFGPASAAVTIPQGTQIKMYVVGNVSTESMQPGDSFGAEAAADVVVGGLIVVRKGAEGQGTVVQSRRGAGSNVPTLEMDWVYAADGTKVALSQTGRAAWGETTSASRGGRVPSSLTTFGMAGYFGVVSAFASGTVSVQPVTAAAR